MNRSGKRLNQTPKTRVKHSVESSVFDLKALIFLGFEDVQTSKTPQTPIFNYMIIILHIMIILLA